MTVILRLQGLDAKASTEDIRSFFKSLHIPDGGVYIVGGRHQEAFIAFSTEKDAQLAMCQTGNLLKGCPVTLHFSNMAEMEQRLNSCLKKTSQSHAAANSASSPREDCIGNGSSSDANPVVPAHFSPLNDQHAGPISPTVPLPDLNAQPVDSSTAFFLGMCTVLRSLKSSHTAGPCVDFHKASNTAVLSEKTPKQTLNSKPGYIRLFGLPASTTKEDICHLLKGLTVQEVIVNVKLGVSRGCLVKFAKLQDAFDALRFNELGSSRVEVRGADEKLWNSALQDCGNDSGVQITQKPKQHGFKESANERDSVSVPQLKRQTSDQSPLEPSKKLKPDSRTSLSPSNDYTVMVKNIPKTMTKTELKQLFGCPNIPHYNVIHLLDRSGNRTDTAFLLFNCSDDFDYAMNLSGCHVGSGPIEVLSISKETMREMLSKHRYRSPGSDLGLRDPRIYRQRKLVSAEREALPCSNLDLPKVYIYVRNLPEHVQKSKIKSLFRKFKVEMDDIVLLHDRDGNGKGEAVVKFASEQLAEQAQLIDGKLFLGNRVILTCINVKQMKYVLVNT